MRPIQIPWLVPIVCLLLCGCATSPDGLGHRARFREGDSASVVLRFYRWDNFFIIRPECRENGFLRPLHRDTFAAALQGLNAQRDMAVVLLCWNPRAGGMDETARTWRTLLDEQGFRRVVCLAGSEDNRLDGLPVIDDWKKPVESIAHNTGL